MSDRPAQPQPGTTAVSAGPVDHGAVSRDGDQIAQAVRLLASQASVSLVWADQNLKVTRSVGRLIGTIAPGTHLADALPALFGLDDDFNALRTEPGRRLEMPNIRVIPLPGVWHGPEDRVTDHRIDLTVTWDATAGQYIAFLVRALSWQPLQQELVQNVRARQLAEELIVEQAADMRETNETLARLNQDLAEFAHVVSHDLKGPMRAMRYFADDLEASLLDPNAGDPREHIARLKTQSRRMTSMLTSLLAFAKLDQKSEALECVDTHQLVRDIVSSLPRPATTEISVTGEWPPATTWLALLDVVLRNLIENAIKHADADKGRIAVACEVARMPNGTAHGLNIAISDNGPGIAHEHQDAIFKPFTQLKPQRADADLTEGTGMGLALVRRAVERAQGEITVASQPDRAPGTTFTLAWPCQIAANS